MFKPKATITKVGKTTLKRLKGSAEKVIAQEGYRGIYFVVFPSEVEFNFTENHKKEKIRIWTLPDGKVFNQTITEDPLDSEIFCATPHQPEHSSTEKTTLEKIAST